MRDFWLLLYNLKKDKYMYTNPESSFSISFDSVTKFISAGVCILLIGAAIGTRSILAACLCVLVIGLGYAYSARGYAITGGALVIRRLIGNIEIPLGDIRELRAAEAEDLRGCIRLFGSGGFFGYYGLYRTSKLGKCSWYVTQRDHGVVVVTGDKTFVLSPDDVNGFVMALRMAVSAPQAGLAGSVAGSAQTGRRTGRFAKILAIAIGILALLLTAGALLYSPGPPEYTLNTEGLAIHDRFYPVTLKAAEIDLASIETVNIKTDPDWRVTTRTNGFANFHYASGWYKAANGQKVRMYHADSRILVLLPPKGEGAPVLLEVNQPDAFIRELRQLWQ
jgi:hypothetical protein